MKIFNKEEINYGYDEDVKGGLQQSTYYVLGVKLKTTRSVDYTVAPTSSSSRIQIKGFKPSIMENKKQPHLIGIIGQKQSGKNTVASMLKWIEHYGQLPEDLSKLDKINMIKSKWDIKAFGTNLKLIVSILSGCTLNDLESEEFKNSLVPPFLQQFMFKNKKQINENITYRQFLQYLGTNILRKHCPAIWVDSLFNTFRVSGEGELLDYWIISDVRFLNEVESIKSIDPNGLIIKVIRKDINDNVEHESENIKDLPCDIIIHNDGDLKELGEKINQLIEKMSSDLNLKL